MVVVEIDGVIILPGTICHFITSSAPQASPEPVRDFRLSRGQEPRLPSAGPVGTREHEATTAQRDSIWPSGLIGVSRRLLFEDWKTEKSTKDSKSLTPKLGSI